MPIDGFVQCYNGEDEDFELCQSLAKFPDGVLKCNTWNNITILAVPCNYIIECFDGRDEIYCHENTDMSSYMAISIYILLIIVFDVWCLIHATCHREGEDDEYLQESACFSTLKGNDLANLKVKNIDFIFQTCII